MGLEPRGGADRGQPEANPQGEERRERPKPEVKSFDIRRRLVCEAWERVWDNKGAPGVDAVSIAVFASEEKDDLYKLWLCRAGGYAEPAVTKRHRCWSPPSSWHNHTRPGRLPCG